MKIEELNLTAKEIDFFERKFEEYDFPIGDGFRNAVYRIIHDYKKSFIETDPNLLVSALIFQYVKPHIDNAILESLRK